MPRYRGVDGVARQVVSRYRGVSGVARSISKGYRGVDGVARQYFAKAKYENPRADTSQATEGEFSNIADTGYKFSPINGFESTGTTSFSYSNEPHGLYHVTPTVVYQYSHKTESETEVGGYPIHFVFYHWKSVMVCDEVT